MTRASSKWHTNAMKAIQAVRAMDLDPEKVNMHCDTPGGPKGCNKCLACWSEFYVKLRREERTLHERKRKIQNERDEEN